MVGLLRRGVLRPGLLRLYATLGPHHGACQEVWLHPAEVSVVYALQAGIAYRVLTKGRGQHPCAAPGRRCVGRLCPGSPGGVVPRRLSGRNGWPAPPWQERRGWPTLPQAVLLGPPEKPLRLSSRSGCWGRVPLAQRCSPQLRQLVLRVHGEDVQPPHSHAGHNGVGVVGIEVRVGEVPCTSGGGVSGVGGARGPATRALPAGRPQVGVLLPTLVGVVGVAPLAVGAVSPRLAVGPRGPRRLLAVGLPVALLPAVPAFAAGAVPAAPCWGCGDR